MNKRTFEISDALTDMDDAIVSEAVHAAEKPKKRRLPILITVAAAFVVVVGTAIVMPRLAKQNHGSITTTIPTAAPPEAIQETLDSIQTASTAQTSSSAKFNTVSAVAMAVSTGWRTGENEALHGLTKIFMPAKVPYGAELADIEIWPDEVIVKYQIAEEFAHDEEDPNRFVLKWHRTWLPEEFNLLGQQRYGDSYLKDGVWITRTHRGLENYAIWMNDGNSFEIILPGYYSNDEDIIGFTGLVMVDLINAGEHSPYNGFEPTGYMWLQENDTGIAPIISFAYGTTYYKPEDGSEGRMLPAEGKDFIGGLLEGKSDYEQIMDAFPHVGLIFEPVLLEDVVIAEINVYDVSTLEPLELNITLERLREIAELNVSDELRRLISETCLGNVLVDIIVVHQRDYIPELNEHEIDAYHCGFIIECGH